MVRVRKFLCPQRSANRDPAKVPMVPEIKKVVTIFPARERISF